MKLGLWKVLQEFSNPNRLLNYHVEMDGDYFEEWFKKVLPLMKDNLVIPMDNVLAFTYVGESCYYNADKRQGRRVVEIKNYWL